MAGENGHGRQEPDDNRDPNRDSVTGRFLPGNCANPKGRPPKKDFATVVAEVAPEVGLDFNGMVCWSVKKLFDQARAGDTKSLCVIIERLFGAVDKNNINIDVQANAAAQSTADGTGSDPESRTEFVEKLGALLEERGLLKKGKDGSR